jgi:hypothetical protein
MHYPASGPLGWKFEGLFYLKLYSWLGQRNQKIFSDLSP